MVKPQVWFIIGICSYCVLDRPVFERRQTLLHPELIPWWSFLLADGAHYKKPHSPTHPIMFQETLLHSYDPEEQMTMALHMYRPRWFQWTWFEVNPPDGLLSTGICRIPGALITHMGMLMWLQWVNDHDSAHTQTKMVPMNLSWSESAQWLLSSIVHNSLYWTGLLEPETLWSWSEVEPETLWSRSEALRFSNWATTATDILTFIEILTPEAASLISCCPACRTYEIATRFWVVVICPIIKCLTVLEFSSIQFNIFIVSTASDLQGGAILTSTRLN